MLDILDLIQEQIRTISNCISVNGSKYALSPGGGVKKYAIPEIGLSCPDPVPGPNFPIRSTITVGKSEVLKKPVGPAASCAKYRKEAYPAWDNITGILDTYINFMGYFPLIPRYPA